MPSLPKRHCRKAGCAELITSGSYCKAHQASTRRQYDQHARNADAKQFYNSAKWKRTRDRIIAAEPICRQCKAALSHAVDHIVPREQGGSDLDINLQPLCQPCHSAKTMHERGGNNSTKGQS